MTAPFTASVPTLWHGPGITREIVSRLTEGREALVVVDSAVAVSRLLGRSTPTMEIDAHAVDVGTVITTAEEIARRRPDVIVAIGGGSTLDATKLAALTLAPGRVFDFAVERSFRSALTILPTSRPAVDIVAVPTTLGTSSETNSVGILTNDRGHRLVVGTALRPRHAVIDPGNLMTLTPDAVREGALEALLRLAGASTSPRRNARGRGDAVAIGKALLAAATRDPESIDSRLRLARLSAATQRSAALRGHDPYSARHWYVANELAFAVPVRKMMATAAIVAAVWRRICSGDPRWGDRASLESFWSRIAREAELPLDPPAGIAALIRRWGVPLVPRPSGRTMRLIATATERAWGDRLPMLPGLLAPDLLDLLRDSLWSLSPSAESADFPSEQRR